MAEQKHSFLYYIYDDLVKAVSGICDKVYLQRRPKTESQELKSFIVIEIPTRVRNLIAGGIQRMPYCYGTITVYCKAKKDGTLNPGTHLDLVDQVVNKFPINGNHIAATRPQLQMEGEDGFGYQVTLISFTIRGK